MSQSVDHFDGLSAGPHKHRIEESKFQTDLPPNPVPVGAQGDLRPAPRLAPMEGVTAVWMDAGLQSPPGRKRQRKRRWQEDTPTATQPVPLRSRQTRARPAARQPRPPEPKKSRRLPQSVRFASGELASEPERLRPPALAHTDRESWSTATAESGRAAPGATPGVISGGPSSVGAFLRPPSGRRQRGR